MLIRTLTKAGAASVLLAWFLGGGHAVADKALASGSVYSGEVSGEIKIPLQVVAGDFIQGRLAIKGGEAHLALWEKKSLYPKRVLLESVTDSEQFRFVASDFSLGLHLSSSTNIQYELTLEKHIPLREQHSPARKYMSPTIGLMASRLADKLSVEENWSNIVEQGTPLIEASTGSDKVVMTFLYRGAKNNVILFGAPSNDHQKLEQLLGTDIWFKSFLVPHTTRLSYQLAPDVPVFDGTEWQRRAAIYATAQADPNNLFPWPEDTNKDQLSPFNYDSSVSLKGSAEKYWLKNVTATSGDLRKHSLSSSMFTEPRTVWLYRSANFNANDPEAVLLVMFDGEIYTSNINVPVILDNLVAKGLLGSVAAVFVDNSNLEVRARELPDNKIFAKFIAQEILPWAVNMTGVSFMAEKIVLAGSSYGGLAASSIALRYPDKIANVISMSGSYWWSPVDYSSPSHEYTATRVLELPTKPIRFFLSAGLFETSRDGNLGILETNRHLRDLLSAKGYEVIFKEYAAGHDPFIWREAFTEGILALFAK